ncbi:MAG: prolipoprotein diacylglyceryl transferase [Acidobacteriota bacterium]|nr:prolipoprotein diacylglyceryl transferase [Acidobacteriota bacterium]
MHPFLFHSGHLLIPTFGVLAAAGLMAALTLSLRTALASGLDPEKLWNAGLFVILSALVLSRLLLVVTNLKNFLHYPILLLTVPSLTATGIALTFAVTLVYLRMHRIPVLRTLDAWSPCATLAWAFLALGHLAEGSDAGLPTTLSWGLPIPPDRTPLHPVPLYVALAAASLTVVLLRGVRHLRPGDTFALAFSAAGIIQFLLTFFRQPYPYADPSRHLLDPVQWIALGMIMTAGLIFLRPRKLVSHAV